MLDRLQVDNQARDREGHGVRDPCAQVFGLPRRAKLASADRSLFGEEDITVVARFCGHSGKADRFGSGFQPRDHFAERERRVHPEDARKSAISNLRGF